MTRLFTGDYSTGDFRQWNRVVNKAYEVSYPARHPTAGNYAATIVPDDLDCGYCARFEIRDGDIPLITTGGERTEVMGDSAVYAPIGSTRWYAFSIKFDPTFPPDHSTIGWDVIHQFKGASIGPFADYGSPVLHFGWQLVDNPGQTPGHWYLMWNPQTAPFSYVGLAKPILELPLALGEWHDIKMRMYWDKTSGTVQVWRNGVAQTFSSVYASGGTTFTGQTVCGGTGPTGITVKQGFYRQSGAGSGRVGTFGATEILYHKGFRIADSEDSL